MNATELRAAAEHWLEVEPDEALRREVAAMLDDEEALREHFGSVLDFGTGGMRGRMGPGTNRMNRLMIRKVTEALGRFLVQTEPDARARGVAVAYDARVNSRLFADEAARVLAGQGFTVYLADVEVPTPVLSYVTTGLKAVAGIIITASHNPPADNGYKVFSADGSQIVPPVDVGVQEIMATLPLDLPVPAKAAVADRIRSWPHDLIDRYFHAISTIRVHRETGARLVYTPVHGVGLAFVERAMSEAGHDELHVVEAQATPDGAFPTVAFPNPEEPGVLDLSYALADRVSADVVLANDPDADRLAVAVRDRSGAWRQLSGNQLGVLIADDLLSHRKTTPADLVVTTVVSTAMLAPIAASHGVAYDEALTGFKWIAERARAHAAQGGGKLVYGFEESIGYSIGDIVRDKDGVSTALFVADLVAHLKKRGRTLLDNLEDLYRRHGLYVGRQLSLRLPGTEGSRRIAEGMERLRSTRVASLAGKPIAAFRDVRSGVGRRADGTTFPITLPSSDVVAFDLDDGSRVLVRPSGTEPKIKFYLEVVEQLADGEPLEAGEARASEVLDRLAKDVLDLAGLAGA